MLGDLCPLPKIPMSFILQNLTISPKSFPRQILGLRTETRFEELVKTFCKYVEVFLLEMPKNGAG